MLRSGHQSRKDDPAAIHWASSPWRGGTPRLLVVPRLQCTQPINSMSIPAQPAMNLKPWTNAMGVYEPAQRYAFELLTIWRESRKTILFVTHGIAEAVFLGTRVVVLTAEPARMAADIEIELPRPRTLELKTDARFGEYTRRIYHLLGLE
jgi:hypothetical protein